MKKKLSKEEFKAKREAAKFKRNEIDSHTVKMSRINGTYVEPTKINK
jgi:hypothetical protein